MSIVFGRPWARFIGVAGVLLLLAGCAGERGLPRAWERVFPSFVAPVYQLIQDPDDPGVLYAACGWQAESEGGRLGGVLRSADRGERWVEASRGIKVGAEVMSLALAPRGFMAADKVLLAGTRGAGLYFSADGGVSWNHVTFSVAGVDCLRLTVQTIVSIRDNPPTVAIGTRGHGVLISSDGGETWQVRNEGLLNMTIQSLVVDDDLGLIAGTWYGGVYRSINDGELWTSLSVELERAALSSVALSHDGTVWVGLQNAGLLASKGDLAVFEEQDLGVSSGPGILAISVLGDRVILGTAGIGTAVGRLGGSFKTVSDGLENKTVSAVLVDRDPSKPVLIGTWGGLYRAAPPRSARLPIMVGLVIFLAAITALRVAWQRTPAAEVSTLNRLLTGGSFEGLVRTLFEQVIAEIEPERSEVVLEMLARRLGRFYGTDRSALAETVRCTAPLAELVHQVKLADDPEMRRLLAVAVDARCDALVAVAERIRNGGGDDYLVQLIMEQDRLFADFLRADSLAHITPLQTRMRELAERASANDAGAVADVATLEMLGQIFDTVGHLSQMPTVEDRALVIGQALNQVLAAQQGLGDDRTGQRKYGVRAVPVVLESVRRLLAAAMEDVRQRADLRVVLRSKVLIRRREAVLVIEIENVGRGSAKNISVELEQDGESFQALVPQQGLKSLLKSQSARLEFVVEPKVSDRVRLSFEVTYDDQVRTGHTVHFADVVEFKHRREQKKFLPLRPNPYVVGRPLLDTDVFTGRDEVFGRIRRSLEGANQDNVVVLIGQRRMGKTSILRRLHHQIGEERVAVLVDLQGLLGEGDLAFFREIIAAISDELENQGIVVDSPAEDQLSIDPGAYFRRRFLPQVGRALGDRRLLLVLDEFEVLEERIRCGELSSRLLPYLRSLMQHEQRVSFMFAGTHRLDELTGDYWGVLFNLAVYLEVGHLSAEDVEGLLVEPTRAHFEIDPLAIQKVYQLTGGHPHFTQLVARELVDHRNQRQLSYITIQDLNAVAEVVAEKGRLHIAYLWEGASRDERLLLLTFKELLEREGVATSQAAHHFLTERRINHGDIPVAVCNLVRKEILTQNANLIGFRVDLLRMWIDRYQNLDSFLLSEASGDNHAG